MKISRNWLQTFFEDELRPVTGIDILAEPIDRDRDFTIISNGKDSTLLYRFEDAQMSLSPGLATLTGCPHVELISANRSGEKDTAEFYKEFREKFRVPRQLCSAVYDNDPYIRHFYSGTEIDAFKARWTD